jgi:hypothetical protein
MTEWLLFMVYMGGAVLGLEGQKIGFWVRVFWPLMLGAALFQWAEELVTRPDNTGGGE